MAPLTKHQREFLRGLIANGGSATSGELGGHTPLGATARSKSTKEGLAVFDGSGRYAHWRITDAGQEALRAATGTGSVT